MRNRRVIFRPVFDFGQPLRERGGYAPIPLDVDGGALTNEYIDRNVSLRKLRKDLEKLDELDDRNVSLRKLRKDLEKLDELDEKQQMAYLNDKYEANIQTKVGLQRAIQKIKMKIAERESISDILIEEQPEPIEEKKYPVEEKYPDRAPPILDIDQVIPEPMIPEPVIPEPVPDTPEPVPVPEPIYDFAEIVDSDIIPDEKEPFNPNLIEPVNSNIKEVNTSWLYNKMRKYGTAFSNKIRTIGRHINELHGIGFMDEWDPIMRELEDLEREGKEIEKEKLIFKLTPKLNAVNEKKLKDRRIKLIKALTEKGDALFKHLMATPASQIEPHFRDLQKMVSDKKITKFAKMPLNLKDKFMKLALMTEKAQITRAHELIEKPDVVQELIPSSKLEVPKMTSSALTDKISKHPELKKIKLKKPSMSKKCALVKRIQKEGVKKEKTLKKALPKLKLK